MSANSPQLLEEPGGDRDGLEGRLHLLEAAVPGSEMFAAEIPTPNL